MALVLLSVRPIGARSDRWREESKGQLSAELGACFDRRPEVAKGLNCPLNSLQVLRLILKSASVLRIFLSNSEGVRNLCTPEWVSAAWNKGALLHIKKGFLLLQSKQPISTRASAIPQKPFLNHSRRTILTVRRCHDYFSLGATTSTSCHILPRIQRQSKYSTYP